VEYQANYLTYSKKQHLFLVAYEFSGITTEVVLYRENTEVETVNSKSSTVKGIYVRRIYIHFLFQPEFGHALCAIK
jgi:hypothetical protein